MSNRDLASRRRVLQSLALLPLSAVGCSLFGGNRGTTQPGAQPAAAPGPSLGRTYGVIMFGQATEDTALTAWNQTMQAVKYDAIPFLRAVAAARKDPKLGMIYDAPPGVMGLVHHWAIVDKKGAPTSTRDDAAMAAVVKKTGLPEDDMKVAHYALGMIPTQLPGLNAFGSAVRQQADDLLYAREVEIPQMQQSGAISASDVELALHDIETALQVCARYHDNVQEARAEVMLAITLATQYRAEGTLDALEQLADDVIERGKQIYPTPDSLTLTGVQDPQLDAMVQGIAYRNAWYRLYPQPLQYPEGLSSKVPQVSAATVEPTSGDASAPTPEAGSPTTGASPSPTAVNVAATVAAGGVPTLDELQAVGLRAGGDLLKSLPGAEGMIEDFQRGKELAADAQQLAEAAFSGNAGSIVGAAVAVAGKFLPPDHIVLTTAGTVEAAMRGDIMGVIRGLDRMTANTKLRANIRDRLGRFEKLAPVIKASAAVLEAAGKAA